MPAGYQSEGVDFDSIFDPYVSGTKPAATGLQDGGIDLNQRYAPRSLGLKADDVGYNSGGQDVSNLWAALGSASYATNVKSTEFSAIGNPTSATIGVKVNTNGEIQITAETGATIKYHLPVGAGVGSLYQARISGTVNGIRSAVAPASASMTGKNGISFTAAVNPGNSANYDTGWQDPDAVNNFLTMQANSDDNAGAGEVSGGMLIEVRRKSDLVVVKSQSLSFSCWADSQL